MQENPTMLASRIFLTKNHQRARLPQEKLSDPPQQRKQIRRVSPGGNQQLQLQPRPHKGSKRKLVLDSSAFYRSSSRRASYIDGCDDTAPTKKLKTDKENFNTSFGSNGRVENSKTDGAETIRPRLITPQSSCIFLEQQQQPLPFVNEEEEEEEHHINKKYLNPLDIGFDDESSPISSVRYQAATTTTTTSLESLSYSKKMTVKKKVKSKESSTSFWTRLFMLQTMIQILVVFLVIMWNAASEVSTASSTTTPSTKDCIYVPGGGFSGFWFTLGRLQSIADLENHSIVCYSAGCLGVVGSLSNMTVHQLYESASGIQQHFWNGTLHRYNVLETFVDSLLDHSNNDDFSKLFSNVQIVTSIPDPTFGFRASINTPTSKAHLKTLLIQTAWIPLATGSHFSHGGHLDGAFSILQHPECPHTLGLAKTNPTLMMNILNVNLGGGAVQRLWDSGMAHGL